MEIRWRLYLYVVANCAYCVAKPVSLNEVIAAESQQKQLVHAASPKLEELTTQRFSLNKGLKPLLRAPKKFKETERFIPLGEKISSLRYKKAFQIKSPLRHVKSSFKRYNNKNQSVKREISGNERLSQKYVPLLRSLGMLFDNLLAESSESTELTRKRKRVRYYTDTSEILCPCSSKFNTRLQSEEEADSAETVSDETSTFPEATSTAPHPTTAVHFRSFRQNKNIPLLLPRNTFGRRGDNNGFGKRSRAAYHRGTERNFPRDYGNSEPGAGDGSHRPHAKDDEKDPGGHSRDYVSSFRSWRRIRGNTSFVSRSDTKERSGEGHAITENAATESESTLERPRGNVNKSQKKDKQQVRRDEAESAELLSAPAGRLRGFPSANKVNIPASELQKNERNVEDYPSDQRVTDGRGALAEEDKETSTRYETVEHNNIPTIRPEKSDVEPVVFIIDGYSVTRNKNGENKLEEKAIHIQTK